MVKWYFKQLFPKEKKVREKLLPKKTQKKTRKKLTKKQPRKEAKNKARTMDRKKITPETMRELERRGYTVAKVEYWSPFPKPHGRRHDLFNCIDVLGVGYGLGTLGVQCTSRKNALARIKKVLQEPEVAPKAKEWLLAGNFLEVWGWDCYGVKRRIQVTKITVDRQTLTLKASSPLDIQ